MLALQGIIIGIIFLFSRKFPIVGLFLPYYKIKKSKELSLRNKLIVNIIAIILIGIKDTKDIIIYLGLYTLIEILYYLLKKIKKLGTIDKIFIISVITGIGVAAYLFLNRVYINIEFEKMKSIIAAKGLISEYEIAKIMEMVKDNFIAMAIISTSIIVFITYYLEENEEFYNWDVSYIIIFFYVIVFFLEKYTQINNVLLNNILEVLKIPYKIYFIKIVSGLLNTKIAYDKLCLILSVFLLMISSEIAFIVGVLFYFMQIRIIEKK